MTFRKAFRAFGLATWLSVVGVFPASAQQYAARHTGDVVQLEDTTNQTVVSVIPSVGNIPFEMKVKGVRPWMGRLDEQAFYANGKRYAFDMDLGNVRGAVPIHGFLTTTDQWRLVEAKADGKSAWVTSRLDFYKHPQWMKQWPFAHTVTKGGKLPDGVTEPAEKFFPNPKMIALKDYNLDDGFTELVRDAQGRAHFVVRGKQQQLDVMFDPNWSVVNVWSPNPAGTGLGGNLVVNPNAPARATAPPAAAPPADRRGGSGADPNFIAIEPMASLSNGLNLAQKGLYKEQQYVQPGATWSARFWVKPAGF